MQKSKVWLSSPHMGGKEQEFIKEAFDTNWVSPAGPNITAFENELSQYLDDMSAVAALSSGTSAIHLALIILGVQKGDEVICSSFTFSGSCNPIAYQGAIPVFVDSELGTWNMDPDLLRKAIEDRIQTGKKPKAIIVVHLYGMPAKMDEILSISEQYEIPIIEDAAEALGSSYKNKMCGTFGDFGILSFNGNKIITTSGGGALVSKNIKSIEKARFLATQARDNAPHYQHSEIGYNYRLSNICAGIGRGQLLVLQERVGQRRSVFDLYHKELAGISGVTFSCEPQNFYSNRWLTTVVFKKETVREKIRLALEEENIESRPLWKPMHLQPIFKSCPAYVNGVSENLFNKGLCLPSGSNLSSLDQSRVIDIIKEIL